MLRELLNHADYTPQKPVLAPGADQEIWRRLPGAKRITAAADALLTSAPQPPALSLTDWLAFTEKGDRASYETPYFARRRGLCSLALAACVTDGEPYVRAAADYAWAICEETAWQLPAHNSYERDAPQLPLPDPSRPIVDLFAAETGALLAMVYALLGPRLDFLAPGISSRLQDETANRVLAPCRSRHFWWMADTDDPKDTPVCNWTPWCIQNVLLTAAVFEPADALPQYIRKFVRGLDRFLDAYGPDGCCDEGAQYYSHAALALYNALELLCRMAPGVFEPAWREPKLRNMAEYILHMHAEGPWYLNFADCSPKPGPRGVREYLFARRVGSAALEALAATDFARTHGQLTDPSQGQVRESVLTSPTEQPPADNSRDINLYEQVQAALAETDILAAANRFSRQLPSPSDIWYPSVGILSVRRGPFFLGVKAGCNGDSHNHNDTGSVTLYKNGQPLLIDIGVETYTRDTFGPLRYTIWTMQSSWHNLPEFDPDGAAYQQLPGPQARASEIEVDDDLGGIAMELAAAYGPPGTVPGLGSYRRRVRLTAEGLHIYDVTDYPGDVALSLMSALPPRTRGNVLDFGRLATLTSTGADRFLIEGIPILDQRLRSAWPDTIYRTRIYFHNELSLEIS